MVDLEKISQQIGSPAYVFDEELFRKRAMLVRSAFGEKVGLCFSIKANPFLLSFVDDAFSRIEVCSPGELRICEACGADLGKIIFSGVNKSAEEVGRALDDGVDILTIESYMHLQAINQEALKRNMKAPVLIRVADESQFGMDAEDVKEIIGNRQNYPGILIKGLHYFTGTQKTKPAQIEKELDHISSLIDEIHETLDFEVEELEYGTGLAVDYFRENADETESARLEAISPAIRNLAERVKLTVEMGRFFAAPCGFYFTRVVDTKCNGGENYAICDGGIHQVKYDGQTQGMQIPKITHLHQAVSGQTQLEPSDWTLCGSLCTTQDILVRDAELCDLKPGDLLVFHRTGAYAVMEGMSTFLSRDMPSVWTASASGDLKCVRKRFDTWVMNMEENEDLKETRNRS